MTHGSSAHMPTLVHSHIPHVRTRQHIHPTPSLRTARCRLEVLFAKASYAAQGVPQMREPGRWVGRWVGGASSSNFSDHLVYHCAFRCAGSADDADGVQGPNVELRAHRAVADPDGTIADMVKPENVRSARLTNEGDRYTFATWRTVV